jgi:hypothetical protein
VPKVDAAAGKDAIAASKIGVAAGKDGISAPRVDVESGEVGTELPKVKESLRSIYLFTHLRDRRKNPRSAKIFSRIKIFT